VLTGCANSVATALSDAQDGMLGRDATANDNTDGKADFSFTKIGAGSEMLPASATSWSCVKGNVTGLMWENKTTSGTGLRAGDRAFTNDDSFSIGQQLDGTPPTVAEVFAPTNSIGFKTEVNHRGLCSAHDWRLPTWRELMGIVDYGVSPGPTIDVNGFPNTPSADVWSSSPVVGNASLAWLVNFEFGSVSSFNRYGNQVRLVRSGQ
jgi:Protein of unknown function (DUF1566)